MQKNNTNLNIFHSNINNKYKLIPFNTRTSDVGITKYLPPVSKEWKNTIYSFYKNRIKNVHMETINANKLIKSYFNLYFKDNKFIDSKYLSRKKRRTFLRRIYVSKMETKHTNSKIKITLYTMNIGKKILKRNYTKLYNKLRPKILTYWKSELKKRIEKLNELNYKNYDLSLKERNLIYYKNLNNKKKLLFFKYKLLSKSLKWSNLYLRLYLSKTIKYLYYNKLRLLRKYQYNYYINKYKFDKGIFLDKLSNVLLKIFYQKPEFNIINLKSITFNPDIFTQALSQKLKRRKTGVSIGINSILNRARLPKVNFIKERGRTIKNKDSYLLENKYPNLSLITLMDNVNLNKKNIKGLDGLLKKIYYTKVFSLNERVNSFKTISKDNINISNLVFNSIKYKNMGGIRLEVKGRLTRRYRADRAVYKLKWKGGLKNIDSSFKNLSTVTYRGFFKPNVTYSLSQSKRRVGAFAVKGWISGK